MSLDILSYSLAKHAPLIKKGMKKIPDDCLEEALVMDTKEFPIFGGESVDPFYFICRDVGEDDKDIVQRIALSRGAIRMHYNDFPDDKEKIEVFLNNITVKNKRALDNDVFTEKAYKYYEITKCFFAVMLYYQHKRNRLWRKKMVDLEYEYRQDCLKKCRGATSGELKKIINLFKARMIVVERFICLHIYGLPGKNYKSWEDFEPFKFNCPSFWFRVWEENNKPVIVHETTNEKRKSKPTQKIFSPSLSSSSGKGNEGGMVSLLDSEDFLETIHPMASNKRVRLNHESEHKVITEKNEGGEGNMASKKKDETNCNGDENDKNNCVIS